MKVLLDENLPHNLVAPLSHHAVRTIDDLGWKGIKNGELLKLIAADLPAIIAAVEASKPGEVNSVECGTFLPRLRRKPLRQL